MKFTAVNRSKSYKASMKALYSAKLPKAVPPGESILLNKGKVPPRATTKMIRKKKQKMRKKAVDFF